MKVCELAQDGSSCTRFRSIGCELIGMELETCIDRLHPVLATDFAADASRRLSRDVMQIADVMGREGASCIE